MLTVIIAIAAPNGANVPMKAWSREPVQDVEPNGEQRCEHVGPIGYGAQAGIFQPRFLR